MALSGLFWVHPHADDIVFTLAFLPRFFSRTSNDQRHAVPAVLVQWVNINSAITPVAFFLIFFLIFSSFAAGFLQLDRFFSIFLYFVFFPFLLRHSTLHSQQHRPISRTTPTYILNTQTSTLWHNATFPQHTPQHPVSAGLHPLINSHPPRCVLDLDIISGLLFLHRKTKDGFLRLFLQDP